MNQESTITIAAGRWEACMYSAPACPLAPMFWVSEMVRVRCLMGAAFLIWPPQPTLGSTANKSSLGGRDVSAFLYSLSHQDSSLGSTRWKAGENLCHDKPWPSFQGLSLSLTPKNRTGLSLLTFSRFSFLAHKAELWTWVGWIRERIKKWKKHWLPTKKANWEQSGYVLSLNSPVRSVSTAAGVTVLPFPRCLPYRRCLSPSLSYQMLSSGEITACE